ncbi:MAG: amidohydrolase family protein [Bacteroidota bacterium]
MSVSRVLAVFLLFIVSVTTQAQKKAIVCKTLIDGTGKSVSNAVIIIEGERILSIGSKQSIPKDAQVIDLGDFTVLPGMIDLHSHPLAAGDEYQLDHLRKSSAQKALEGLKRTQDWLNAGWTTLRTAGDADVGYATLEIRDAINKGLFVGPRIYGAGHWISVTGGGGDINFLSYEQHPVVDGLVVDGPDEMLKAVRNEIKYGSDWIKILVTGAYATAGDNPQNVHFSSEELKVAMEEAARRDVPVMAHAHSADGIKMAVRAGARTIEHGSFMDEEGMKLMIEHKTVLVPTLTIFKYTLETFKDSKALAKAYSIVKGYESQRDEIYRKAIKMGVKIGVGTDFFATPAEYGANEFSELVRLGMTPMQAIVAGTKGNSEVLGKEKEFGTIEAGKLADIIAVKGDPIADINELKKVKFVMIGGKVVKQER